MSITDELRKYVQGWRETPNLMDDLDAGDIDGLLGDFEHIADHIDAEHERQLEVLYRDMSDAEYIKLPVDMDGEPIHVGDWMTPNGMGMDFKVRQMHFNGKWSLDLEDFGISQTCPDMCHHAPTVEDVLREFAAEFVGMANHVDDHEVTDAIEMYASKLRLAGDAE